MAAIGRKKNPSSGPVSRVSPLKPGLRGARNWATSQIRAASYSRKGLLRLSLSLFFIFILIVSFALWLGGYFPHVQKRGADFTRARLMSAGFVVKQVDIMGEGRLREADVSAALGVHRGDFLFSIDLDAAKRRVEGLSWVDKAIVRRLWPNRIVVQVIERRPYALWQNEGAVKLVDAGGRVIDAANPMDFTHLRLIVGQGAAGSATQIETHLSAYPPLSRRVAALVHVGERRWNLSLDEGRLTVMLPEVDQGKALARLAELQDKYKILDRRIERIDLRLPDRLTLRQSQKNPV